MDDASRPVAEQYQDSTRWLLVVLVVVSVLAAGVIAVADVPDLVGRRWQAVGAASAALTVLALLVAVYVVLRALDPAVEEDSIAAAEATDRLSAAPPVPDADETSDGPVIDVSDGALGGTEAGEPVADGARRSQRQIAGRFRRARSFVGAAVVLAFLGMAGMTVAAVADGNNIEDRQRRALAAEVALEDDGPITDPQAVGVQLTTRGLQRVAEAMGCTGQDIGLRSVQGWAVSGTFRDPTVVLFGPVPACDDIQIALAPRDGFVYPTAGIPAADAQPATASTTTTVPSPAPGTGAGAGATPASTPTTAPAAP